MACSAPKTSSGCNPSWQPRPSFPPAISAPPMRRIPPCFRPRTSRNAMIVGIVLICFAPHVLNEYTPQPADPDRHLRHRRPRPQHRGRLHRPDLDRPRRLLRVRRVHLSLSFEPVRHPRVLLHSARGRGHGGGRPDLRPARGAAEGALSRDRDAGRAIHPAGFLRPRRMVHRRQRACERGAVLDLRLFAARR